MTPPPDPLEGLVAAALSDARAIGIVEPQAGPDGEPYELIGLYTPGMRAVLHRLAHAARQQGIEEAAGIAKAEEERAERLMAAQRARPSRTPHPRAAPRRGAARPQGRSH